MSLYTLLFLLYYYYNNPPTIPAPLQQLSPSSQTIQHWKNLEKELVNIDSLEAWAFVQNAADIDLSNLGQLYLQSIDLNKDGQMEMLVCYHREHIALYQQKPTGQWKKLWEEYNEGGQPSQMVQQPQNWIKSYHHMSCSNCAIDGVTYYYLDDTLVKPIIGIDWYFSFDFESNRGEIELYEQADGDFTFTDTSLLVDIDIEWSTLGDHIPFLKDTIQIHYAWQQPFNGLQIKWVHPQGLEPYIRQARQQELCCIEYRFDGYFHACNEVALRAYFYYQQAYLLSLKQQVPYQLVIRSLERQYKKSWQDIVVNWPHTQSFASRIRDYRWPIGVIQPRATNYWLY